MSVVPCTGVEKLPETFECGEDFCQACGDCLSCYGETFCAEGDPFSSPHTYAPDEDGPPVTQASPQTREWMQVLTQKLPKEESDG